MLKAVQLILYCVPETVGTQQTILSRWRQLLRQLSIDLRPQFPNIRRMVEKPFRQLCFTKYLSGPDSFNEQKRKVYCQIK